MRWAWALALVTSVAGCRSKEEEVFRRGGTPPIACIEPKSIKGYEAISTCRDGAGATWFCGGTDERPECITYDKLTQMWVTVKR